MRLTIIGAGYVGLVTGACFAELGHEVICLDRDIDKIRTLREGRSPLYEPGLQELLSKNLDAGKLSFTERWETAVASAEVVFIAVGTPTSRRGNGYADMSYVYEAACMLAPYLNEHAVVVNKSTVPVGSAREVRRKIAEVNPQACFEIASNPEFLREGEAIHDFMRPARIVLGVETGAAREKLERVYQPFRDEVPLLFTGLETAELIKYASNAFLATKLSFINEMAQLCEAVGADVLAVSRGMGLDPRIGPAFLHAGPGYGGSCFPKDTLALIRLAQEYGAPTRIVETVVEVNHAQKARMVKKIREALGGSETGKTLAVLGLTFKPDTDDLREAPALTILPPLIERGLNIRAHDPVAMQEARQWLPDLHYCADPYEACSGADAVCLMTEWSLYRTLDLQRLKAALRHPVFVDLRNVYDPALLLAEGFQPVRVGVGSKAPPPTSPS